MVSQRIHRNVTILTRIGAGLLSAASLSLFIIILAKVFDYRFPATGPGYSVLPVVALSIATIWDVVALVTLRRMKRVIHASVDIVVFLLLAVLGSVGFAHDDKAYLSNGMYKFYSNELWLDEAIIGGGLMLAAALFHAVLIFLGFFAPKQPMEIMQEPPPYLENLEVKQDKELDELSFQYSESAHSGNRRETVRFEKGGDKKRTAEV